MPMMKMLGTTPKARVMTKIKIMLQKPMIPTTTTTTMTTSSLVSVQAVLQ